MTHTTLIIGGISSGKTRFALELADRENCHKIYIATAPNIATDTEMQAKITTHKLERGQEWQTREIQLHIVSAIQQTKRPSVFVIDCLTLWLSNMMFKYQSAPDMWGEIETYIACLIQVIKSTEHPLIFVTADVGYSPVHEHTLVRQFQQYQGRLNQAIAKSVNSVYLVTAGIANKIK